jgi:hypothetical protein
MAAQSSGDEDPDVDSLLNYIQLKYGLDGKLISGFQYYTRYPNYKGDPFFPEDSFFEGSVSIRGLKYDGVRLKYNIFSQSLLLEYTDVQEGYNLLRFNNSQIDSFRLGTFSFQKLSLFSNEPTYYQILSSEHLKCYINWKKGILAINNSIQYTHVYTGLQGTYYLFYEGRILNFTNRKSFQALFPVSMQVEIRDYIKNHRFSFRKAGPKDIENLIVFVSKEIEKQAQL